MTTTIKPAKLSRTEVARRIAAMPDGAAKNKAAAYALRIYGAAPVRKKKAAGAPVKNRFLPYQFKPEEYIEKFLKWVPWKGLDEKHPGQLEILQAIARCIRQQIEKRDYEKGLLKEKDLKFWKPGETIKNWFRVESGNGIGKTKMLSGTVQYGFDCFDSVVYTFHTSATQDELTTWAEIGQDRGGKGLPGRLLKTKIELSANRFAVSRSTSDAKGQGEERTKGKHKPFLFFVVDEADGVPEYVFKAIETMESGGISVVLMTANPRSRKSKFHRIKKYSYVKTFRISSLFHPNVVQGKEVIPGAVKRDFIEKQMEKGVEIVHAHAPDDKTDCTNVKHKKFHVPKEFTFELPYPVKIGEKIYLPGTIFKPKPDFMTTVLGITPPNALDKTIISVGVYEAACARVPEGGDETIARVGVDSARSGGDKGTVYIRWQDAVWRSCELASAKTEEYIEAIATECLKLKDKGVTSLHIRVDAAYGSGVIDGLRIHAELKEAFTDFQVFEVHFGSSAYNRRDFDNVATEMYYETAEALLGLSILDPPESLEIDLTEREFKYINRAGKTRKILEPKDDFKKRNSGRSPDDGDGFVLAVAPDYCFNQVNLEVVNPAVSGQTTAAGKTTTVEDLANFLGLQRI